MSSVTLYLAVGAVLFVGLFLVNALFYRRRHGSFLPRAGRPPAGKPSHVSPIDALAAAVFVGMLLVAKAAPYVAPGSNFALWLEEPYAFLVYVVWAWISATVLLVAIRVAARKSS